LTLEIHNYGQHTRANDRRVSETQKKKGNNNDNNSGKPRQPNHLGEEFSLYEIVYTAFSIHRLTRRAREKEKS
jgi:hypothetical protein